MIIGVFFLLAIATLLNRTVNKKRKHLAFGILLLYSIISLFDMYWLFQIEEIPLHPSDPSFYFEEAMKVSFTGIFKDSHTNLFYPVINWLLSRVWYDPYWFCIWIKIDNCLIAVFIYLLLTYKNIRIQTIDYILLFNPYMILTLNRNVRDVYLILFILIIIIGMGAIKNRSLPKSILIIGIILLGVTRPVLLGPLAMAWMIMKWKSFNYPIKVFCVCLSLIIGFSVIEILIHESMNQMISAMDYAGEDFEDLKPLLYGDYSLSSIIAFIKRFILSLAIFLLTPNPFNFYSEWTTNMSITGASNIYTGFDNFLIFVGSIYYYAFIVPYFIYCLMNLKRFNKPILWFSIFYAILYAVSYLGQTDIRNHNTFIYFFLVSIMYSKLPIKLKLQEYIASGLLCLGIGARK